MKWFIFRNNTIEQLFGLENVEYSGYEDISYIPSDSNGYIWFYQIPFKYDLNILCSEINGFADRMRMLAAQLSADKTFIVLTMANLYPVCYTDSDTSVSDTVIFYNNTCRELEKNYRNVRVIDFSEFTGQYPISQLINWKYYFISQTVINPVLAGDFRKWFSQKVASIELKRKKCLVLDLDNTLWGGILGEDGIDGIKIGGDYPGKAFLYFQKALVELSKAGVILTVCSKNNEQDVLDVWEKNPFMALRKEHVSAYRINWNNKADNIKELSEELNIGLDSMVFIDDNPTERELIRQILPMVEVPEFPVQPYNLPVFFQDILNRYFRVYAITDEDRNKTLQYKANAERANEQKKFSDFTDYLRSLQINIKIEKADTFNLPRIAQMTQKTNQFNLTTKRYTESDLNGFLDSGWKIYCIDVSDKFGDNGITGVIMLKPCNSGYEIDSLLLSCRILGKGIEKAFVKYIVNILQYDGVEQLTATYIPTKKNMQVAEFYDSLGFELVESLPNGEKRYMMSINGILGIEDYYTINEE